MRPPPVHGALVNDASTTFRVWAPDADRLTLVITDDRHPMVPVGDGYFELEMDAAGPGTRYQLLLDDDGPFPDPASRHQPNGVHGPSQVVDPTAYNWADGGWTGVPREALVIYELHVGTFTPPARSTPCANSSTTSRASA